MMSDDLGDYEDDKNILDDADLWRRIPPRHIVPDKNLGGTRISSAAFDNHPGGTPMSVVLGQEVLDAGRDAYSVISGHAGYLVASITAGYARSVDQGVSRSPLPDEPAHAEVFGRKTRSVRKKLAEQARWIIGPES